MDECDFLIIGAGIAGLAAAAELAPHGKVALIEQEAHPCFHSSGRSAAIFVRSYGNEVVQAITARAGDLFAQAQAEGLFSAFAPPRGVMVVTPKGSPNSGEAPFREYLTAQEAARLMPCLDAGRIDYGWWEPGACDIDVHAMQTGYLRVLRAHGGALIAEAPVRSADYRGGRWHVEAGAHLLSAPVVVNAAGAWIDRVASLFGAHPLGVTPMRRSAVLIDPPGDVDIAGKPMVVDVDETVYFKPDAGRLMLSPADATPVEPHDCWPEDLDLAIAIDRYERLTGNSVSHVHRGWAGLRSFVPDECPLAGPDPDVPGLHWLGALGGFGVQTAPALARLISRQILDRPREMDVDLIRAIQPGRICGRAEVYRPELSARS
ncbi:NAD(P)/FAD-dependent oxidoreductase [Stakelama tenebrarum]|uniref:FAD-binding oxidoreductase n=1 Tax=Stakelama tenebrarum TaxID=2711215 RepID=A0A6G6Y375_9SPHN|nr:FAD-binding oxidoreductase [Sphingosinithalassobacter tenebrarum]QIG79375.1 FAD-binding oxidoreductase [Sphingosinithalassobacter tenebrarum]